MGLELVQGISGDYNAISKEVLWALSEVSMLSGFHNKVVAVNINGEILEEEE